MPRRLLRRSVRVRYFHQLGDPYSLLAAQYLEPLADRYGIRFDVQALPAAQSADSPQQSLRRAWAERDVQRLAPRCGIQIAHLREPVGLDTSAAALRQGESIRHRSGLELAGMFAFEGEWYAGVDRLHYLEQRLGAEGCLPLFAPPSLTFSPVAHVKPAVIHFYCSLRSPYTYLACERLNRLAAHYRATIRLRPLMPMVKRGVPLSRAKRFYLVRDAAREGRRLGIPFGDIADPLGIPAERGLAVLHRAIGQGRGEAFLESFLRGVFAQGIDAGTMQGLGRLAQRVGIEAREVASALGESAWREEAEHNRRELHAQGLWGVPSFQLEGRPALWGQDRLWMLEEDLRGRSSDV